MWLIKHLNNPYALQWFGGFLADQRVAGNGIEVLDQLVWSWNADPANAVPLLLLADSHRDPHVREISGFIRGYLAERSEDESTSSAAGQS